jgi:hypothetical protein
MRFMVEEKPDSQESSGSPGILYILFSAFAFLSGWLLSKSQSLHDVSGESIHPQNTLGDESRRRQFPPSFIAQVAPTPQRQHTERRSLAESAVAVGTIGLLIVNLFLLIASWKTAVAAKDSIDLARKNARFDQRAVYRVSCRDSCAAGRRTRAIAHANFSHRLVSISVACVPSRSVDRTWPAGSFTSGFSSWSGRRKGFSLERGCVGITARRRLCGCRCRH